MVKLQNDSFKLKDLGIPFIGHDSKIFIPGRAAYMIGKAEFNIIGFHTYRFHRALDGSGTVVCDRLYDVLRRLSTAEIMKHCKIRLTGYHSQPEYDVPYETIIGAKKILDRIVKEDTIAINGIDIKISEYETDGEYFNLIRSDGTSHGMYNVKKYYSVVSGEYVMFLHDNTIQTFTGIKSIEMSKDVRIMAEDLKKLWS